VNIYNKSVTEANRLLNELVDQYRFGNFAPFVNDGDSHIKFISDNKFDYKLRKYTRRLFLEIQVAREHNA